MVPYNRYTNDTLYAHRQKHLKLTMHPQSDTNTKVNNAYWRQQL